MLLLYINVKKGDKEMEKIKARASIILSLLSIIFFGGLLTIFMMGAKNVILWNVAPLIKIADFTIPNLLDHAKILILLIVTFVIIGALSTIINTLISIIYAYLSGDNGSENEISKPTDETLKEFVDTLIKYTRSTSDIKIIARLIVESFKSENLIIRGIIGRLLLILIFIGDLSVMVMLYKNALYMNIEPILKLSTFTFDNISYHALFVCLCFSCYYIIKFIMTYLFKNIHKLFDLFNLLIRRNIATSNYSNYNIYDLEKLLFIYVRIHDIDEIEELSKKIDNYYKSNEKDKDEIKGE